MAKKQAELKPAMGANVQYCGHAGYFIADIWIIAGAAVVHASQPITPGNLFRNNEFGPATHLLSDFPSAGFWKPHTGVFAVPVAQVTKL